MENAVAASSSTLLSETCPASQMAMFSGISCASFVEVNWSQFNATILSISNSTRMVTIDFVYQTENNIINSTIRVIIVIILTAFII